MTTAKLTTKMAASKTCTATAPVEALSTITKSSASFTRKSAKHSLVAKASKPRLAALTLTEVSFQVNLSQTNVAVVEVGVAENPRRLQATPKRSTLNLAWSRNLKHSGDANSRRVNAKATRKGSGKATGSRRRGKTKSRSRLHICTKARRTIGKIAVAASARRGHRAIATF